MQKKKPKIKLFILLVLLFCSLCLLFLRIKNTPLSKPILQESGAEERSTLIKPKTSLPKKVNVFGPYENVNISFFSYEGLGFVYQKEGKYWAYINGEIVGPYERIDSLYSSGGIVSYRYKKGGETYLKVGDQTFGPYEDVRIFYPAGGPPFGLIYKTKEGWFIKIDKKVEGPFEAIGRIRSFKDKLIITYKQDDSWYLKIGKEIKGPFDEIGIITTSGNNLGYIYRKHNNWFVKINQKTFGPYQGADSLQLLDEFFIFRYQKGGKWYLIINLLFSQ